MTFDSATGSDVRGRFTLPVALAMGDALPGSVQSDASGRAILVTGPPLPGGSGQGVLFRSDAADPRPLPVAHGVDRGVWVESTVRVDFARSGR